MIGNVTSAGASIRRRDHRPKPCIAGLMHLRIAAQDAYRSYSDSDVSDPLGPTAG